MAGVVQPKHNLAMRTFDRYIESLDVSTPNDQVLRQLQDLKGLLKHIKDKENAKMDLIEKRVSNEEEEIETLKKRLKAVTNQDDVASTDYFHPFKPKYVKFCTTERKEISKLLGDSKLPCDILKKCYTMCEHEQREKRKSMTKNHFLSEVKNDTELEDISLLQKQYCGETANVLFEKIKSDSTSGLGISYQELCQRHGKKSIDKYFEKCLDICWNMLTYNPPLEFRFDKHIKEDKNIDIDIEKKVTIEPSKKSGKKGQQSSQNIEMTSQSVLELKYPAVIQGSRVIAYGLKQKKIF